VRRRVTNLTSVGARAEKEKLVKSSSELVRVRHKAERSPRAKVVMADIAREGHHRRLADRYQPDRCDLKRAGARPKSNPWSYSGRNA